MGLLSKSLLFSKKERGKAKEYAEPPEPEITPKEGESHEAYEEMEEPESEEEERQGLLEKASAFSVTKEEGEPQGLLQKASSITAEITEEKVEGISELEVSEEEEVLEGGPEALVAPDIIEKELLGEEAMPIEGGPGILEAELEEMVETGLEEVEELIEKPEPELEEEEALEEKPVKSTTELLEEYIQAQDSIHILRVLDEIIRQEGYTAFINQAASSFLHYGKGKTVIVYLASDGKYVAEHYLPEDAELKKIVKKSIRSSSKLIERLISKRELSRSLSSKDEALLKETVRFQGLEPWMAIPLLAGADLAGFVIIGNQPKRPKLDLQGLALFSHLCAGYINRYLIEKSYVQKIEKIEKEKETQEDLLNLYTFTDIALKSLTDALDSMYSSLDVDSAALITGWEEKGKLTVFHSIGIPEKLLKKYKIQKNDREIRGIIEGRVPAVPKDAKKRISKWTGEKNDQFKTYITVPIVFHDELLGVINIHRMKGAGFKVSGASKGKIAHGARSVIPYFLEWKITHADPFSVLQSAVQEEIAGARNNRQSLHFILFALEAQKKSSDAIGPEKYAELALKVYESIHKRIGEEGLVKRVDLSRSLLVLRSVEDVGADEVIKEIQKDFKQRLKRGKLGEALTLVSHITRYPQDRKDTEEILRWVYGII